jgi:ABC-type antimicrobial peptide transport system permease subunit
MFKTLLLCTIATIINIALAGLCTSRVAQYAFDDDLTDAAVLSPGSWSDGATQQFIGGKFNRV